MRIKPKSPEQKKSYDSLTSWRRQQIKKHDTSPLQTLLDNGLKEKSYNSLNIEAGLPQNQNIVKQIY